MSKESQEARHRLVIAAVERILDVPEDAPLDEMKAALDAAGIDVDGTIARVRCLTAEYPRRLLDEARHRLETERREFEAFQHQLRGLDLPALQEKVGLLIAELPPSSVHQMQAYHREISERTGGDVRSELVDLLWQLIGRTTKGPLS